MNQQLALAEPATQAGSAQTDQSLSKSMVKAMGCERYFAMMYASDEPVAGLLASSEFATTGTDFHRYRELYVNHLIGTRQRSDTDWAVTWIESADCTDDARDLIMRDIERFEIDPDMVYGTEVYLSIDSGFFPVEMVIGGTPGEYSRRKPCFARGELDLLSFAEDGEHALIDDYKTGWSNAGISEYEAAHYAALVFVHFRAVQRVTFRWEFIRAKAAKPAMFTRDDLDSWIIPMVRAAHARRQDIAARFRAGQQLTVDPTAGLCGWCPLVCPLRDAVSRQIVELPPIQSEDDARVVAARTFVASKYAEQGRERLREWLEANGRVDLGNGWVAEMEPQTQRSYPLPAVLEVLGVRVIDERTVEELLTIVGQQPHPEIVSDILTRFQQRWDVPVEKLTVASTALKQYARAKKRAGLQAELDQYADAKPRFELKIHKPQEATGADAGSGS